VTYICYGVIMQMTSGARFAAMHGSEAQISNVPNPEVPGHVTSGRVFHSRPAASSHFRPSFRPRVRFTQFSAHPPDGQHSTALHHNTCILASTYYSQLTACYPILHSRLPTTLDRDSLCPSDLSHQADYLFTLFHHPWSRALHTLSHASNHCLGAH
jgi:hypothetical protein